MNRWMTCHIEDESVVEKLEKASFDVAESVKNKQSSC